MSSADRQRQRLPLLSSQTLLDRDEDSAMSPKRSPAIKSKQWLRQIHISSPVPRWRKRCRPGASSGNTNYLDSIDLVAAIEAISNSRTESSTLRALLPLDMKPKSPTISSQNSPSRPEIPSLKSINGQLPPLEIRILQRPRLSLPFDGPAGSRVCSHSTPTIVVEEIVQLREQSPDKVAQLTALEAALRLSMLPKKCLPEDEVALMPCHSLAHRGFPTLAAELWREPIRDRDKDWRSDELNIILSNADVFASRRRRGLGMTLAPSPLNRGKWRRWEAQKLHVKPRPSCYSLSPGKKRQREQSDGVLLRNHGAMISKTYCLVSIFGVGIVGRLYDAGVSTREQLSLPPIRMDNDTEDTSLLTSIQRYLRLEAYDPLTSCIFVLRVTLNDLAWAFHERPEFLVAGKKQELLRELIGLLYFDYPGQDAAGTNASLINCDESNGALLQSQLQTGELQLPSDSQEKRKTILCGDLPKLRLSQERRLSEAARRRLEREARLRWEEEQRLLALAAFMKLPRRARHRLACKCVRLHGRTFIISVYHLPAQVRSFIVVAYHPRTSTTFRLAVGIMEIAAFASVLSLPHTWSTELRRSLAESVVPRLRFRGSRVPKISVTSDDINLAGVQESTIYEDYRAALSVQDDRAGPWALPGWLPQLEGIKTIDMVRVELAEKRLRDSRRALELAASTECNRIHENEQNRSCELEQQISALDDQRTKLLERDAELVKQIEEIDSRGSTIANSASGDLVGSGSSASNKIHHELRRAHKAERKSLKAQLKAVSSQATEKKRELHLIHEQSQLDIDKQQRRLRRKLEALATEDASSNIVKVVAADIQAAGNNADCKAEICTSSAFNQSRQKSQRTQGCWLSRAIIRDAETTLLAAGACRIEQTQFRYSLYALEAAPIFNDVSAFRLEFYEGSTCSRFSLELTRLDWLSLTKSLAHEQQLHVPEFAIAVPASIAWRVQELESRIVGLRGELTALHLNEHHGSRARKTSTAIAKMAARHREIVSSFSSISFERRQLSRVAPWNVAVRALCSRLRLVHQPLEAAKIERIEIDRCIFRAVLPVISIITNDDDTDDEQQITTTTTTTKSSSSDNDQVVDCHVRAILYNQELVFEVFDPFLSRQWQLPYPDSLELVKEFAGNTFMEQQLHIEAIAMSMILFVDGRTGNAELRFED